MTRPQMIVILSIVIVSILVAAGLVIAGVVTSRQRQLGPEHPGVSLSTPPLPPACDPTGAVVVPQPHPWPAFVPARPAGRHRDDSIELIPAHELLAREQRLREIQQTRVLWLPLDSRRKEGGA